MSGRRQSVTAQLSRQARRFSAVLAPQLVRLDPIPILQKVEEVIIGIDDIANIQKAGEQYVLRNSTHFAPINFNIVDRNGFRIMTGSLYPDHMQLVEAQKTVCNISLAQPEDTSCIGRIKHPISGMTVYDFRRFNDSITIQGNTDEIDSCRIISEPGSLLNVLMFCGCVFSKEHWHLMKQDIPIADISPNKGFFSENSIKVSWANTCDNELRLIAICFGLIQMVREAFPSLLHIVKEFRTRNP